MNEIEKKLDEILPRTHCPASCDGYGTYAEMDADGDPVPAQCQWCYEVVIPLRKKITSLIVEEKIDELKLAESINQLRNQEGLPRFIRHEEYIDRRIKSLKKGISNV